MGTPEGQMVNAHEPIGQFRERNLITLTFGQRPRFIKRSGAQDF